MEGKTSHKNATEPFGIQHVKRIRVGICWLHRAAADTHYHAMKAHACASQTFLGSRALLTEVRMPGLKCLVSSGRAGAITGDCIAQCVSPWKFGGLGSGCRYVQVLHLQAFLPFIYLWGHLFDPYTPQFPYF